MKKRRESVIMLLIGLLIAAPTLAETEPPGDAPEGQAKKKIVYRKSESHKFGGLSLKGKLKKPELGYIYKRRGLRQEKIINIPEDFNGEIIQGAGQF